MLFCLFMWLCSVFCVFLILASISFSFSVAFALRSESVANVLTPKSIPTSLPVFGKGFGSGESYKTIMNHWLFFNCIYIFDFSVYFWSVPFEINPSQGFPV